ncbi:hypothetical protein LPJ66_000299 [Kickxella alabastrina]|uniref:Uncharacterized protein n=1 Tax=Kickxella alabastrina TaxID=61397 RepID=A0ACC1IWF6_9FUNG|nr:hypothetical protein LPJ66_000299 [Kickxella alabastrina]
MAIFRAEESRLKREIERCQALLHEQQTEGAREARMLAEKITQAESRIQSLQRERGELRQRVLRTEADLRAKQKECSALEKQQVSMLANPRPDRPLRDHAEAANAMCARLKAAMEKMRTGAEEDRRRLRALEQLARTLEQQKDAAEAELRTVAEQEYPRKIRVAEEDRRMREEQWREETRRLGVTLQEARDNAARYMAELGEATVHATALEAELQKAREQERLAAKDTRDQVDRAMDQLAATHNRMGDLERLSRQRAEESERVVRAAGGHVDELKAEVARLEAERARMLGELNGEIQALALDYRSAQRDFASSVKGADEERGRRLADAQREAMALRAELSELRGVLLKKEMAWKDKQVEIRGYLQAAADDYEALRKQSDAKQAALEQRLRALDEQAQASEAAWAEERSGLLTKLDGAHKDGYRLRDALDALQKEAAQTKADCDADLRRMALELGDVRADAEKAAVRWAEERRELQRAHREAVNALKEENALLEQGMRDTRVELELQLHEMQAELEYIERVRGEELDARDGQLADTESSVKTQARNNRELQIQLEARDAEHEMQVVAVELAAEEAQRALRRGHEQQMAALQDEHEQKLAASQDKHEQQMKALQGKHGQQMAAVRRENAALEALSEENNKLRNRAEDLAEENNALRSHAEDLAEGLAAAGAVRDDALSHYIGIMHDLADRHSVEKDAWKAEREAMRERVGRYQYREAMYAISQDYLLCMLDLKEDARAHMVREARSLYCELQDQAAVADDHMDAGNELALDLQRLLSLDSADGSSRADGDVPGAERMIDELRTWTRHAFIDDMERLQEARVAKVRIDADLRELKSMRVQGEIVETVGGMSAQYRRERARLEDDLAVANKNYQELQNLAAANRQAFESRIYELEAALNAELERQSGLLAANNSNNGGDRSMLEKGTAELQRLNAELEARIEGIGYEVEEERMEYERQLQAYDRQVRKMNQVLEQCEGDMASQVDDITQMHQYIVEIEGERAVMAEQSQFQINWLKENYTTAYRDLDNVLSNNGGGHNNLRQRIKYVEGLKSQILALKKENFEYLRERNRYKQHVVLLKSELDAYKEVGDAESIHSRALHTRRQTKSVQSKQ